MVIYLSSRREAKAKIRQVLLITFIRDPVVKLGLIFFSLLWEDPFMKDEAHYFILFYFSSFRGEHRLGVFENRLLRRIFGPKRDEGTGEFFFNTFISNQNDSDSIS
jgi:hypothetical protein